MHDRPQPALLTQPATLRRGLRRACALLVFAGLILAQLAIDGIAIGSAVVPVVTAAAGLVVLAQVARPRYERPLAVLGQQLLLGVLAPLWGLAVLAQHHYVTALVGAGGFDPPAAWAVATERLETLFLAWGQRSDLALTLGVSTAAGALSYLVAHGRCGILLLAPLPSLVTLLVVREVQVARAGHSASGFYVLEFGLGMATASLVLGVLFAVAAQGTGRPASGEPGAS